MKDLVNQLLLHHQVVEQEVQRRSKRIISAFTLNAAREKVKQHAISRYSKTKKKWEFVEMTSPCTTYKAQAIAAALQGKNPGWKYRLWDCR